ncbi:MAG: hypothetical protein M3177_01595 [Pseudomonadota bacterium]|nr:hypothetical protein [Pseudomonadota bacterium]
MMKRLRSLLGLGLAAATAPLVNWPELPSSGFLSGRSATESDVAAGNAVFAIQPNSRGPMPVEIPQYAYWNDDEGQRHPVIMVQAEYGPNGEEIVGLRGLDGSEIVATLSEVTLLGQAPPR